MVALRHKVPTQLNIEDRAFFGMTLRQVAIVALGGILGYGFFKNLAGLPAVARLGGGAAILLVAVVFALWRPLDRGLEEWAFILAHHWYTPRHTLWHPRPPVAAEWRADGGDWAGAAPRVAWAARSVGPVPGSAAADVAGRDRRGVA